MSSRRNRPPNRWGCKPDEDVCVMHDLPLECRHGCKHAKPHSQLHKQPKCEEGRECEAPELCQKAGFCFRK